MLTFSNQDATRACRSSEVSQRHGDELTGWSAEGVDEEAKVRFGRGTRQMEPTLRRLAAHSVQDGPAQGQESVWRLECMDGHE
jgi:hypothetical protein